MGGRDRVGSAGQMQVHLGAKLRQLFDAPLDPLPERFVELLNALAAQKKERPPISSSFKSSLLALIPNLRAFAFSFCGNHEQLDDLVQDTLLKAWSHMDSLQEGTNLRAWLFTILRNSFFSEMRKRRRQVEDSDGSKVVSLSVAPAQDGHVDMEDMRKALALIPADQREALILVGAAGMSYEEAAE